MNWDNPLAVDLLDEYIQSDQDVDIAMAKIPSLFGTSLKATYLGYRAMGLSAVQALEMLNLNESQVTVWREEDLSPGV